MSVSSSRLRRRLIPIAVLFGLLFGADFVLGSTPYSGAAELVVLLGFAVLLAWGLLSGSLGLKRIIGQESATAPGSTGPIARGATVVALAMGGDYGARAEVARTLKEAMAEYGVKGTMDPRAAAVLDPQRPDPGTRQKATKASREEYLRSLEEALVVASSGGVGIGE